MKQIKTLVGHRWRTVVVLGLVFVLALSLLPAAVLAYGNPSATAGWGRLKHVLKHGQPSVLDEELGPDETDTPQVDETEDDEAEEEDETPDADDTDEITTTLGITAVVTLRGPISALPEVAEGSEASLIGEWVVAGQAVQVTAETQMSDRASRAEVGDWAQVWAQREDSGDLVAVKITVMHANHLVRIVGVIEEIGEETWVVAGATISVTAQTRIVGTPTVGAVADVHGSIDDAGAFVAEKILVRGTGGGKQRQGERERHGKGNPGVGEEEEEDEEVEEREQEDEEAEEQEDDSEAEESDGQARGNKHEGGNPGQGHDRD